MRVKQIATEELLQIWEAHFGSLTTNQRKSFKFNSITREICNFDRKSISRAITLGGRKYLKDILEYLEGQDRANASRIRPVRSNQFTVKVSPASQPVHITGSCGHRYRCTCFDAYSVSRLIGIAA